MKLQPNQIFKKKKKKSLFRDRPFAGKWMKFDSAKKQKQKKKEVQQSDASNYESRSQTGI